MTDDLTIDDPSNIHDHLFFVGGVFGRKYMNL